ncbi:MAG: DUF5668 domain-containing protein [Anaerolineales bacterium]|jgi:uncharacterized membrane protein HdeD (DUF308 family)
MSEEIKNAEVENNDEWKDWGKHYSNRMTWGIALIVIGGLFLLDTLNVAPIHFYNWWAIFIMVPGINFIITAFQRYQQDREFSEPVHRAGFRGILLILVSLTFFLNFDWGIMFSIFLIGEGLYLLLLRR